MTNYTAHAIATLTVEIDCGSNWGTGTTMDQVYKQAREDALGKIRNMSVKYDGHERAVRVVGEPVIKAVIAERNQ